MVIGAGFMIYASEMLNIDKWDEADSYPPENADMIRALRVLLLFFATIALILAVYVGGVKYRQQTRPVTFFDQLDEEPRI